MGRNAHPLIPANAAARAGFRRLSLPFVKGAHGTLKGAGNHA